MNTFYQSQTIQSNRLKRDQSTLLIAFVSGFFFLTCYVAPVGAKNLRDWGDKINQASKRFKVLKEYNNEAVLDNETQLVWEREPGIFLSNRSSNWFFVRRFCLNTSTGDRKGWRLPSAHELASLIDASQSEPALPEGHPFTGAFQRFNNDIYWTATTSAFDSNDAFILDFSNGTLTEESKNTRHFFWCVRGGSPGPDAY